MSTLENGTKRPFRIIIVGGGICGLSAAIALRGPGREITILEQSSFLREIGAAISLQPNASKILEQRWRVGTGDDATEPECKRVVDKGFRIYSTEGELVKEIPLVTKVEYGADRIIYHRRDLHALLLHAATSPHRPGPPASLRLSTRVASACPATGTVRLADSTTPLPADLVVAADGIHSALRAAVLGRAAPAAPTGLSAYRFMAPVAALRATPFAARVDPAAPYTSMVMGWDRRLVMGPCRVGEGEGEGDYAVVAIVPDGLMREDAAGAGWRTEGSVEALREAYRDFPEWLTGLFDVAGPVGLWQLRDLEPLERWRRGRVVLVGDAAHAMLPTQGQGASQSLEDAEALGAMFEGVDGWVDGEEVERRLEEVVKCRYERATLIQAYSRNAAKPATNGKDSKVTLTTAEFMDYNCTYNGAKDFQRRQREGTTLTAVQG
ncbi:Monooxygenase FAD-binding protein [Neofusicoccum parvum]|nr:Monooxygenase FAD-binding protein [Neofusicoccum parvum]